MGLKLWKSLKHPLLLLYIFFHIIPLFIVAGIGGQNGKQLESSQVRSNNTLHGRIWLDDNCVTERNLVPNIVSSGEPIHFTTSSDADVNEYLAKGQKRFCQ